MKKILFLATVICLLFMTACTDSRKEAEPISTPEPPPVVTPTPEPTPTATPEPTPTSTPEPEPTPAPTPTLTPTTPPATSKPSGGGTTSKPTTPPETTKPDEEAPPAGDRPAGWDDAFGGSEVEGPGMTAEEWEAFKNAGGAPGLSGSSSSGGGSTSSGGNGNVWVPPAGFVEPGVVTGGSNETSKEEIQGGGVATTPD